MAKQPPVRHAGLARLLLLVFLAMIDLLFIAVTVIFFAAAWGYARACERL